MPNLFYISEFLCRLDKGYVRGSNGDCVCPPAYALDLNDNCVPCAVERGFRMDESGHCVCALERGLVIDERGKCVCPLEHGYILTQDGDCVPDRKQAPGCTTDLDCAYNRYCEASTGRCEDPCTKKICGVNAFCNATNHRAICQCITGFSGDAEINCSNY